MLRYDELSTYNDFDTGGDGNDNDSTTDDDDIVLIETEEKNTTGITEFSLKTTDVLGQWEKHTKASFEHPLIIKLYLGLCVIGFIGGHP